MSINRNPNKQNDQNNEENDQEQKAEVSENEIFFDLIDSKISDPERIERNKKYKQNEEKFDKLLAQSDDILERMNVDQGAIANDWFELNDIYQIIQNEQNGLEMDAMLLFNKMTQIEAKRSLQSLKTQKFLQSLKEK